MSYCKANSCYTSTSYSWNDYCSYHERCLSKLREYNSSIGNIKEIETFETYFNKNCGYVINYDSSSSYPYYIWIVVFEPAVRNMSEKLAAVKYKCGYSGLSGASNKANRIKNKLQNGGWYDTPMLKVHPEAKNWKYFSSLITSPYVKDNQVGTSNNVLAEVMGPASYLSPIQFYSGSTPNNLDRYFKPLDVVQVKLVETISGARYYHVGIYLGDVSSGNRICHFTRERNGVRLTDWEGFLEGSVKKIVRYHPMIPFKYPRRIAEQIAWAYSTNFREDQYDLRNRNCEHFANMCVYGVNYSGQIEDNKGRLIVKAGVQSAGIGVAGGAIAGTSIVLAPFTFGLSLIPGAIGTGAAVAGICENAEEHCTLNNNKGSTIKLVNEMSESNSKLGERDNWLSDRIKANIEIPPKEHCRIM